MTKIAGDIFIPKAARNGAVEGHKVVVELTTYPEGRMNAEGKVVQILGHKTIRGSISFLLSISTVFLKNFLLTL